MFWGDCVKLNSEGPPDLAVVVIFPAFPRPTDPPLFYPYLMKDSLFVLSFNCFANFCWAKYSRW